MPHKAIISQVEMKRFDFQVDNGFIDVQFVAETPWIVFFLRLCGMQDFFKVV